MALSFVGATSADSTSSSDIAYPAGLVEGDVLFYSSHGNASIASDPDWTIVAQQNFFSGGTHYVYYRRVPAGGLTGSYNSGTLAAKSMIAFRGVRTSGAPNSSAIGAITTSNASSVTTPAGWTGWDTQDSFLVAFGDSTQGSSSSGSSFSTVAGGLTGTWVSEPRAGMGSTTGTSACGYIDGVDGSGNSATQIRWTQFWTTNQRSIIVIDLVPMPVTTTVSATLESDWGVSVATSATLQTAWDARSQATASIEQDWGLRARATTTLQTSADVHALVARSVASVWDVQNLVSVSASAVSGWDVLTTVTEELNPSSWAVLASAEAALGTSWDTRSFVQGSRATAWDLNGAITGLNASLWNVYAPGPVSFTGPLSWDVRAAVSGDLGTAWDLNAQTLSTVQATWDDLATLTSTRQTLWDVLIDAGVASVTTDWGVFTLADFAEASGWDVNARITRERDTGWIVISLADAGRPSDIVGVLVRPLVDGLVATRTPLSGTLSNVSSDTIIMSNAISGVIEEQNIDHH